MSLRLQYNLLAHRQALTYTVGHGPLLAYALLLSIIMHHIDRHYLHIVQHGHCPTGTDSPPSPTTQCTPHTVKTIDRHHLHTVYAVLWFSVPNTSRHLLTLNTHTFDFVF